MLLGSGNSYTLESRLSDRVPVNRASGLNRTSQWKIKPVKPTRKGSIKDFFFNSSIFLLDYRFLRSYVYVKFFHLRNWSCTFSSYFIINLQIIGGFTYRRVHQSQLPRIIVNLLYSQIIIMIGQWYSKTNIFQEQKYVFKYKVLLKICFY